MKKALLLLFLIAIPTLLFAQKPLSNSRQSSYYSYFYRLNDNQVTLYYQAKYKQLVGSLSRPIDSVKTDLGFEGITKNLSPGNYLKVSAVENKIQYNLIQQRSAFLHLLENRRKLRFVILDRSGNEITDAAVLINGKRIAFNSKTKLYSFNNSRRDTLINVKHGGVSNFYNIAKQSFNYHNRNFFFSLWWRVKRNVKSLFKKPYFNRYNPPPTHPGYMVFNKPMYKPGDTIKLKAFILDKRSKKPISDKRVLVRLKEDQWDNGKVIGYADAYRKGGFEYQFHLNDSLDIDLDDKYFISLESLSSAKYDLDEYDGDLDDEEYLNKRTVYQQGSFEYEEYELKANKFAVRVDKKEHVPGNPPSVYFKVTDENDLNVMDGRVELLIKTIASSNYKGNQLFIPDTLWRHKLTLDNVGETKLILPDSIFPKANVSYVLVSTFLNSNNERLDDSKYINYHYADGEIQHKLNKDTLKIDYLTRGKIKPVTAQLYIVNSRADTLEQMDLKLPGQLMIKPGVAKYIVKVDSIAETINLKEYSADISASGFRTRDSVFINVTNPRKLNFRYTIFDGKTVLDEGTATAYNYAGRFVKNGNLSFLINYLWAGQPALQEMPIPYQDKLLTIEVKQPVSVYPGQQADIQVNVKDAKGNPVEGADLTAYAITRKFKDYASPYVPYLGKEYAYRKVNAPINLKALTESGSVKLNWQQWGRQLGLDSIEYYKFTNPLTTYQLAEPAPGNVTQIAPFVVKDGDILPVHILYIDNKPVYFSKTNNLQRYSFKVDSGKHDIRLRTTLRDVNIKNVYVPLGKKLILSVADTSVNDKAQFIKMPDTLTAYEANLINKYLISIVPNFGQRFATLGQGDELFLVNNQNTYNRQPLLVGPLNSSYVNFGVLGEKSVNFLAEPGYSFEFQPELLKQKSIPTKYPFDKKLLFAPGITEYRHYALTRKEVDSLWQQFVDLKSASTTLYHNTYVNAFGNGKLLVTLKPDKNGNRPFIKNMIIYRNDDPDFMNIYPGNQTDMGYFKPGKYRIFYLLKGNSYYLRENIIIKPNGTNFYNIDLRDLKPADAISLKIAAAIQERIGKETYNTDDVNDNAQLIKEIFNEKYLDNTTFTSEMSGYVYDAEDKKPIPGVTVRVKGVGHGASTDSRGRFNINVPQHGKLVISFIGYYSKEITIHPGEHINVELNADMKALQEVVVIGYGTTRKSEMTGSVSNVLAGRVAGVQVNVRGSRSTTNSDKPILVVDGVIVPGGMENLAPGMVADISILKDAAAVALYGSQAAGGAIIVTTTKAKKLQAAGTDTQPVEGQESYRRNFSDYAFWQPKLMTDKDGNASFKVTFPDDITNWRTFVIGATDNKQTGIAENQIKSYKPLSAALTSPLFAVKGDVMIPIGKVSNYTTDTITLNRKFSYNGNLLDEKMLTITNSKIDSFRIIAEGKDSLTFEYAIKRANGYFDGERRSIPVFEQGVMETKGIFEALEKDTTLTLTFDPKLKEVTFRAEASALPVLLEETEYLRNYEYLCNEQLASKLKGLLSQKKIKTYLGEPFKWDKDIREIIKKLQESRRKEGTWGWWKDSSEELWISLHAVEALLEARAQGFAVRLDEQKLIDYLTYQSNTYKAYDKVTAVKLLMTVKAKADVKAMIADYEKEIAASKIKLNNEEKYRLMLLRQQAGMPVVIDSLLKDKRNTMFGNVYWGKQGYHLFNNATQQTLLAYQILKNEGKHPQLLSKLRNYFLEQRKDGKWRNTYESSLILETILPDLLVNGQKPEPVSLVLSGNQNQTITQFPYTTTLTGVNSLTVQKKGAMPVYITAYQKFWNSEPEKVNKDFTVNTWFERNGQKIGNKVKGGESIMLKAEVIARGDADFVMLEIPIPAGCSYESKEQQYYGNEVHREYFKNKVSIFCRKLTEGKHTFSIKLVPRYSGTYHVNPAKAEMMYFPVFYGREGMKLFNIE